MKNLILILLTIGFVSCGSNFNTEQWKTDKSVRQNKANDLIKSKILLYKTYDEIIQLLGESDLDSRIHDSIINDKKFKIQYILGGCNFIDYERLVVEFYNGKTNKVYKNCD